LLENILTTKENKYTINDPQSRSFVNENAPYFNLETLIRKEQKYIYEIPMSNKNMVQKINTISFNFLGNGTININLFPDAPQDQRLNVILKLTNDLNNNINKVVVNF
jgi:hypothetical protein